MPDGVGSALRGSPGDRDRAEVELRWVGSWACAPQLTDPDNLPPRPGLSGNTLRQKVFATLDGRRVRVRLSNEWGEAPLTLHAAWLARAAEAGDCQPGSERALCFEGQPAVTIAAGQACYSDACEFALSALDSLCISLHFGAVPQRVTGHAGSRTTSYLALGGCAAAASLPGAAETDHWYFISGIDVEASASSAAIVALGDSITDGRGSTTNGNDRWPDQLARRLKAERWGESISVLNLGIGGNAVLRGGLGPTASERFERDVLGQRGARFVIVLEGINDLGASSDVRIAEQLIDAYRGFVRTAHAHGLTAYGVPILPFAGSHYDTPVRQAARHEVNAWLRGRGCFDAVLDLDRAVEDPARPGWLLPAYDSGDHLHLCAAGYRAMAGALDLSLFRA